MNRTRSLTRGAGSSLILRFPTVLEPQRYNYSLIDDAGAYGSGSRTRTCVPVLIAVVVALQPTAVSYDQEVSEPIVIFSRCCRNSPRQVHLAPPSSSSRLVVIVDASVYGKSS